MINQPTSVLSRELLPASIAIFCTAALASFQALGIAAALPDIAADLGDVSLLPWAITAFLLTSSLATVIAGPFIDSVGVKRMFRLAVTAFVAMGFASAFAPTMPVLILFRVLQGAGAGLILSCGNAAISLIYPDHLVGRAFAANATVWGVMGVVGPAVAASILTFLSWQWIFYLNLPLGILALAAGWRVLPGPFGRSEGHTDVRGPLLLVVMTVATLFAVNALSVISFLWLAAVVASIAFYVRHARRSPNPVVRLEHVSRQPYLGLGMSTAFLLTGIFAVDSYIPLFVRAGKNGSAALTAWSVLPITVGWTIGANLASRLADRHSESWIILLGFLINTPALGVVWFARARRRRTWVAVRRISRSRCRGWDDNQHRPDAAASSHLAGQDGSGERCSPLRAQPGFHIRGCARWGGDAGSHHESDRRRRTGSRADHIEFRYAVSWRGGCRSGRLRGQRGGWDPRIDAWPLRCRANAKAPGAGQAHQAGDVANPNRTVIHETSRQQPQSVRGCSEDR